MKRIDASIPSARPGTRVEPAGILFALRQLAPNRATRRRAYCGISASASPVVRDDAVIDSGNIVSVLPDFTKRHRVLTFWKSGCQTQRIFTRLALSGTDVESPAGRRTVLFRRFRARLSSAYSPPQRLPIRRVATLFVHTLLTVSSCRLTIAR